MIAQRGPARDPEARHLVLCAEAEHRGFVDIGARANLALIDYIKTLSDLEEELRNRSTKTELIALTETETNLTRLLKEDK